MIRFALISTLTALLASTPGIAEEEKQYPTGYTDTEFLPGDRWRVHDDARPRPRIVDPGRPAGGAPSDAIVLFDGKDLANWVQRARGGKTLEPSWKVENGYMEVVPGTGSLMTKEAFGDVQLHVEWATPATTKGASQARGNSGVMLMALYEIQVLDSYENISYADGQAGAIYGQFPPLVNASREPGDWQSYDIVFEAPRFEEGELRRPAYATVFHNGVLLHHRRELMGPMRHRRASEYAPHEPELPLLLQGHGNPVRYRNIWIRRLDLDDGDRE